MIPAACIESHMRPKNLATVIRQSGTPCFVEAKPIASADTASASIASAHGAEYLRIY
jgi:hypothetical protein